MTCNLDTLVTCTNDFRRVQYVPRRTYVRERARVYVCVYVCQYDVRAKAMGEFAFIGSISSFVNVLFLLKVNTGYPLVFNVL